MTENALVVRDEMSLQDTMTLGKTLVESGFFDDAASAAKAVVKILAGREIGLGPIASMTGIHIIQKRVTLGANVMAATVKRDPRYDYRVIEMTAERCELAFFERGAELGHSVFTAADAAKAGTKNMAKFPRNMLFARAMSNGVKWYCPDAFGGAPVYTPDELGAEVDGEGNLIEMPQRQPARPMTGPEAVAQVFDGYDPELAEAKRETADLEPQRKSWPAAIVSAIVDAHLAANTPNTTGMLNLSNAITPADSKERIMTWATFYRSARGEMESKDAAATADTALIESEKEKA